MKRKMVSVILSSYNAKERLIFALASYINQDFPKHLFEVIVVDDGSSDKTYKIFNDLSGDLKIDYSLKYIRNSKNMGRVATRNRGIKAACGEIIIFSDSDMIAERSFISKHVAHHQSTDEIFVGGSFWNRIYTNYYLSKDAKLMEELNSLIKQYPIFQATLDRDYKKLNKYKYLPLLKFKEIYNQDYLAYTSRQPWSAYYEEFIDRYGEKLTDFKFPWIYFVVMNVSVKMKHLQQVGLFDENFKGYGGEDDDIGYRLYKAGLKVIVDDEIKNYHQEHPRSVGSQEAERKQNRIYLTNKHFDLAPLIHYGIPFLGLSPKNQLLMDVNNAMKEHIVSDNFENNFLNLLIAYHKKDSRYLLDFTNLTKDMDRLKLESQYIDLAHFIKQLIRQIHKERSG